MIDFTPELRAEALEIMQRYQIGGPYMPRVHVGYDGLPNVTCSGGLNITHPAAMDPEAGIMYVSHGPRCGGGMVRPGAEVDDPDDPMTTGVTVADWVRGPSVRFLGPQGLPIQKPPYNRASAYDMNTGERLFWVPIGETPEAITNHPALQGLDLPNTGGGGYSILMVTRSLLLPSEVLGDQPVLTARNKRTGEVLGRIELPTAAMYGMMTYLHEGKQHIVVQIGGSAYPSSRVAIKLP